MARYWNSTSGMHVPSFGCRCSRAHASPLLGNFLSASTAKETRLFDSSTNALEGRARGELSRSYESYMLDSATVETRKLPLPLVGGWGAVAQILYHLVE